MSAPERVTVELVLSYVNHLSILDGRAQLKHYISQSEATIARLTGALETIGDSKKVHNVWDARQIARAALAECREKEKASG